MSLPLRRIPPLHALAAFEAAARLGGFAPAANELCVTPSAISHRIRQLEASLELQLFERTPTGVRLTGTGRRYLASVREAFEKLAQGGGRIAEERERVRVAVPPTFARQLLMPRLPGFLRQHPEVEVTVNVALPIAHRSAEPPDVEVWWGEDRHAGRIVRKLFDDRLMALAAPGYVASLDLSTPRDLARAELLRAELLPWRPWFDAAGLDWPEPARGSVLNDLGMLLEVAAAGLGVALCTGRIAAAWLESGRLEALFALHPPAPVTYHLVSSEAALARRAVESFWTWLGAAFE